MFDKNQPYLIEGVSFNHDGLYLFCRQKLSVMGTPYWERDIWAFILTWLDSTEIIEVNTSGSTSKPKTVSLSKKHMEASALATCEFFKLKNRNTALLCLPVKYIAGKMMIVRALVGGLNLVFVEPNSSPDLSPFKSVDFAAMVPMQLKNILGAMNGMNDLEKINKLIVGGGFLSKSLEEELQGVKSNIWQTYGMTETITHIALRKINGADATAWYRCLDEVKVMVNEKACLVIDYEKIGVHALQTNDLVEMDANGRFKILGRIDNVVNSGAVKLFPESIEEKLEGIIDSEFFVAGIPDEVLGERLTLFVEGEQLNPHQTTKLLEEIKKKLSGFEVPKEIVFLKAFNRTMSGKIIRPK